MGGSAYDGTLADGAIIISGQAVFNTSGPYVNISNTVFSTYTSITIEAWVSTGINTVVNDGANGNYARIFEFGQSLGISQDNSLGIMRNAENGLITIQYIGAAGYPTGPAFFSDGPVVFNSQIDLYVAITCSAGNNSLMYLNGTFANTSNTPSPLQPQYFYIGKSLYSDDSGLIGSVNEFRIWGGILSPSQILTHFQQGPSKL